MWRICKIVAKVHTWQCGLLPPPPCHLYLAFLPMLTLPNLLTPRHPSPSPPKQIPVCDALPSLCPCVLMVQHSPMSENMVFDFLFLFQFAEMMVSRFIHVSTEDMNSSFFYGYIVFHGVYVPHFPCPVYHWWAFGLVPGFCYCKQCCYEHMCSCVFMVYRKKNVERRYGL